MTETLRRMARSVRAGPVQATADGDLARAIATAAQKELDLDLRVTDCRTELVTAEGLADRGGDQPLMVLLKGAAGETGLALLDQGLFGALVAQRMTGRQPASPPPSRAPSRIDAEIAGDFLNRLLSEVESVPAPAGGAAIRGYRFQGQLADARLIRFTLAPQAHLAILAGVTFSQSKRPGQLIIVWPAPKAALDPPDRPDIGQGAWRSGLRAGVMQAKLPLHAVLTRIELPLDRVMHLKVGDDLTIAHSAIDTVLLNGPDGRPLARGRLGQVQGKRAVKLHQSGLPVPAHQTATVLPKETEPLAVETALRASS